jgi:hypothetical protein
MKLNRISTNIAAIALCFSFTSVETKAKTLNCWFTAHTAGNGKMALNVIQMATSPNLVFEIDDSTGKLTTTISPDTKVTYDANFITLEGNAAIFPNVPKHYIERLNKTTGAVELAFRDSKNRFYSSFIGLCR